MNKAKLIEKLRAEHQFLMQHRILSKTLAAKVNLTAGEIDYILTSLTAPVPDGKEEDLTFEKELESLINRYSKENESNTPDFILAGYLIRCLSNYNETLRARDNWHEGDKWHSGEDT